MLEKLSKAISNNSSLVMLFAIVIIALLISGFSSVVSFSVVNKMFQWEGVGLYSDFKSGGLTKDIFVGKMKSASSSAMDLTYLLFVMNAMVVFLFIWALQVMWFIRKDWSVSNLDKLPFYVKAPNAYKYFGFSLILSIVSLIAVLSSIFVNKFYLEQDIEMWQVQCFGVITMLILFLYPACKSAKVFTSQSRLSQNEI